MGNYDASQVKVTFGLVTLRDFADGTFVEVSFQDEKQWEMKAGADGNVSWNRNTSKAGVIKATLKQTSPSNQFLRFMAKRAEAFPITVISNSSMKTVVSGTEARILNRAGTTFSKEEGTIVWEFGVADMDISDMEI